MNEGKEVMSEILIEAHVYVTAYEEAIRKWRRKVEEIYAILLDTRSSEVAVAWDKYHRAEDELLKLAAEMDQTVKQ